MIRHVLALTFCMMFISTFAYATVKLTSTNTGDILYIYVNEGSRVKVAPEVFKYKAEAPYPYTIPLRVIVNCKSKQWKVDSVIEQSENDYRKKGKAVERKINWEWEYITIKDDHGGELCR